MRLLALACVLAAFSPALAGASTGGSWTTHRSTAGFSVSAPSTWIDVTRLTPQVLAKAKTLPALRQYVDLVRTTKAIKLLLADASATSLANRYATNVNVVQASTIGDLRFQRDSSVATLRSTGVVQGAIRSSYVTLPAGKSASLSYNARFSQSTPVVSVLQFMFLRAGTVTVVTYTTLPKLRKTYAGAFARSARSFRFR